MEEYKTQEMVEQKQTGSRYYGGLTFDEMLEASPERLRELGINEEFCDDSVFGNLLDTESVELTREQVLHNRDIAKLKRNPWLRQARLLFGIYCRNSRVVHGDTQLAKDRQNLITRYLDEFAAYELTRLFPDQVIPDPGKTPEAMARWKCFCCLSLYSWWNISAPFSVQDEGAHPLDDEHYSATVFWIPITNTHRVVRICTNDNGRKYDSFYLARGNEQVQHLQVIFLSWAQEKKSVVSFRDQLEQNADFQRIITPLVRPNNGFVHSSNTADIEERLLHAYLPLTPSVIDYTWERCLQKEPAEILSQYQPRRGILVTSFIAQPSAVGSDPAFALEMKQEFESRGKSYDYNARWRIYTIRESEGRWATPVRVVANQVENTHLRKYSLLAKLGVVEKYGDGRSDNSGRKNRPKNDYKTERIKDIKNGLITFDEAVDLAWEQERNAFSVSDKRKSQEFSPEKKAEFRESMSKRMRRWKDNPAV